MTQTAKQSRPPVVVVADDDAFVGRAVACILREVHQAQVHMARCGEEALAAALLLTPDLILSDVHMPGMSVLDLCRQLRAAPQTRETPIYLLTGVLVGDPELGEVRQYVQGVLNKPPDPVELRAVLDQLASGAHEN
jgi:CheY-like chemotaxis protein